MATKQTMDAIEKTIDTVEETLDTIERIPKVHLNGTTKKQQLIILGVTAAFSALAGAAAGYFVAMKRLEARYADIATQEIAEAKEFYSILHKTDEYATPESTLENLSAKLTDDAVDAIRSYQGKAEDFPEKIEVETVRNIFTDNVRDPQGDDFDYEEELKKRSPETPYIITQEEFFLNEPSNEQVSLAYYEEDDVLADEADKPVPDIHGTVGDDALHRFGHGSKDKNIVYVRNERLELDMEIARSKGSFSKEVLGFVEHSDRRARRNHRHGEDG
jgi:hypothetical protein